MVNGSTIQSPAFKNIDSIRPRHNAIMDAVRKNAIRHSTSAPAVSRSSSSAPPPATPSPSSLTVPSRAEDTTMKFGRKCSQANLETAAPIACMALEPPKSAGSAKLNPVFNVSGSQTRFLKRQKSFSPQTPTPPVPYSSTVATFSPHTAATRVPYSSTLGIYPPANGEPWPLKDTAPEIYSPTSMNSSYTLANLRPVGMQRLIDRRLASNPAKTTTIKNLGKQDFDDEDDDDSFELARSVDSYGSSFDEERDVVFGTAVRAPLPLVQAKLIDIPKRKPESNTHIPSDHDDDDDDYSNDGDAKYTNKSDDTLTNLPHPSQNIREKRSFVNTVRATMTAKAAAPNLRSLRSVNIFDSARQQVRDLDGVRSLFMRGGVRATPSQPAVAPVFAGSATTASLSGTKKGKLVKKNIDKDAEEGLLWDIKKEHKQDKWAKRKQNAKAMLSDVLTGYSTAG